MTSELPEDYLYDDDDMDESFVVQSKKPPINYKSELEKLKNIEIDISVINMAYRSVEYMSNLIETWPMVTKWTDNKSFGNKKLHVCWHYTRFDDEEWSRLARVTRSHIWDSFNFLAMNNLIYPDGTVNKCFGVDSGSSD